MLIFVQVSGMRGTTCGYFVHDFRTIWHDFRADGHDF